ncbi:MAG: sigma 54-interacting transcriptional regulator [Thermodesulfobacteriota bacterium]|nr:sigma 54-interacting transcriptional regulator [Thermodesulfobacteriota bacterium]
MITEQNHKALKQRIKELEKEVNELRRKKDILARRESRIREVEQMALIGHWELDLITDTLYWSDEIYRIFDLSPQEFGATYKAFLDTVHPDDRSFVDNAYISSLKNKTGYDIVHRLLLRDGTVKYVHEKCKTEYDKDGRPLRSLGTVQDITGTIRAKHSFAGIIGQNVNMQELFETIKELTDVNVPVLIQGESGTGKELVAAAIHNEGPRATKQFVPVNCGALPEGLLESELFGHVKGAFTGALRDKKGRFELADGGTLFLDEAADLPKTVQAKLLRVLQEGRFEPVGSEKTITVDVRLISAANRNLKREVEKGNFRDDLYYRINVVPIYLPPLRERKDDIPLLIENFLERSAHEGLNSNGISRGAIAAMIDYSWPGNVRELQSAIRFALVKSRGQTIQINHLPKELVEYKITQLPRGPSRKLSPENVQAALNQSGGNKAKAARILGVGRATLYRFLSDFPVEG